MSIDAKAVRVRLVYAHADDRDDEVAYQLTLDLIIDPTSSASVGKAPAFGIYGPPLGSVWPFILQMDGSVDYGDHEDAAQGETLNIREKAIRTGEFVTFRTDGEDESYKIVSVTDLATGRPV